MKTRMLAVLSIMHNIWHLLSAHVRLGYVVWDIDQPRLLSEDQQAFIVRHIDIDFVRAASLGDVLGVTSELVKTGGASVKLRQTITNMQFCHIVARLVVDIGFVNLQRAGMARACRMPQDVRDKLAGKERGLLV